MKENIIRLLNEGFTYNQIAKQLGCSKGTISYHAQRLEINSGKKLKPYDWQAINDYYHSGANIRECKDKFGFSWSAWYKAKERGDIKAKEKTTLTLEDCLVENYKGARHWVKKMIIEANAIEYKCDGCKSGPEWNGMPLVLTLDHKNGVNDDYRINNLRFMCPNCDSQSDTYAAKNKKNKNRKPKPYYKAIS